MDGLRWMSLERIRKQQRMRRERVLEAMLSGEPRYEQRGRIRYARACDVEAWEERRLTGIVGWSTRAIAPELLDLVVNGQANMALHRFPESKVPFVEGFALPRGCGIVTMQFVR